MASAIRSGDHKLLWFYDDDSVELYNLANDISESQNLADKNPERTRRMLEELQLWLKESQASRPQMSE